MVTKKERKGKMKKCLRGRTCFLIDFENIVGGAIKTQDQAIWGRRILEKVLGIKEGDLVMIAVSHIGAVNTKEIWESARVMMRSGKDGADLELAEVMEEERIPDRFGNLVLVSGDGFFTPHISRLASQGVHITVTSWGNHLSNSLRMAAHEVRVLENCLRETTDGKIA